MKSLIKKTILRSLVLSRKWGGKHTEIRNLQKGIPIYLIKTTSGKKDFQRAIKELVNDRWILAKKSTGEIHVSLNPKEKEKIMRFISSN